MHFGKKYIGYCTVCAKEIDVWMFHCAHIKARASGGATVRANLTPTCPSCNLSMGTQNLNEFREEHYPSVTQPVENDVIF